MANARATITLDVKGRSRVKAALTGTTQDMKAAGSAMSGASRSTAAAAVRADATRTQSAHRAAQAVVREAKAAERARVGAERAVAREAEKTARTQERIAQRSARFAARQQERIRAASRGFGGSDFSAGGARGGGGMGGGFSSAAGAMGLPVGAMGAATAGIGAMALLAQRLNAQVQGVLDAVARNAGRLDAPEAAVETINQDMAITRIANDAFQGQTPAQINAGMDAMRERVNAVAAATNVAPGALIQGLGTFQELFSDYEGGVASLEALATAATAAGIPFDDLVRLTGEVKSQLHTTGAQGAEVMGLIAQQGVEGRITQGAWARDFVPGLGAYKLLAGSGRGLEGVREYGAIANTVATGGATSSESATQVDRLMTQLNRPEILAKLRRLGGVDVNRMRRQGHGSPTEILDAIHASRRMRGAAGAGVINSIFPELGGKAIASLNTDEGYALRHRLMNSSVSEGMALNTRKARDVMNTTGGRATHRAIVETINVGKAGARAAAESEGYSDFESAQRQRGGIQAFYADYNPLNRFLYEGRQHMVGQANNTGTGAVDSLNRMDARAKLTAWDAVSRVEEQVADWLKSTITGTSAPDRGPGTANVVKHGKPNEVTLAGTPTVELGPRTIAAIRADAAPGPAPVVGPGLGARTPAQRRAGVSPR